MICELEVIIGFIFWLLFEQGKVCAEYLDVLIKLQRKIMAVEETLARYKSWVAEHPQVLSIYYW